MPIHAGFLTLIVRFSGISLKIDGKLPGLGFAISSVLSSVPCLDLFGFKVGVLFFHFQLSQSPSLWHLSFKVYSILCNIDRMRQVDFSSLHLHSFLSERNRDPCFDQEREASPAPRVFTYETPAPLDFHVFFMRQLLSSLCQSGTFPQVHIFWLYLV